jgi:NADPH-dependent curcumin reductase CurA
MSSTNRRWLLKSRPHGMIKDSDFERADGPVPQPGPGEFLVRVTHLSFDPTQRGWLAFDSYMPAVKIGDPVRAFGVGQVVVSHHPDFEPGQMVQGGFGWQDYVVTSGSTEVGPVTPLPAGATPEQALGVLGVTGLTAWFGLTEIGQPKAGDTVLVTGAAGATGSVAIQIAKALGCRTIGVAGGPDKCHWVVEVAGADACIDYKRENVAARIKDLAPGGVDVVFENVGGEILEAGLLNLAMRARVVLCGGISSYNAEDPSQMHGIRPYMQLTIMRARMEGFIVLDYADRFAEGVQALATLMSKGKLTAAEDVQEGFENCPATLRRLFEGKNLGKQILKLADPVTT